MVSRQMSTGASTSCSAKPRPPLCFFSPCACVATFVTPLPAASWASSLGVTVKGRGSPVKGVRTPWCGRGSKEDAQAPPISTRSTTVNISACFCSRFRVGADSSMVHFHPVPSQCLADCELLECVYFTVAGSHVAREVVIKAPCAA